MVSVSEQLKAIRRKDLDSDSVEAVWIVCLLKPVTWRQKVALNC